MILSKTPTLIERRYRAKQSVVAAVCNRRWKNQISAVTDSRYSPPKNLRALCVLCG
jgi:hypothetical protein